MSKELVQIDGTAPTPAAGRKLKAMLLFPPEWVPTAPYLALPSLTAVLRQHGHEVVQKDVNIEMYDLFFSDAFLIWIQARMAMQLRALNAKESAGWLTDQEGKRSRGAISKLTVHDEDFRLGVIEHESDGRGIETRVERIQHAARHRYAVMDLQHGGRVGEQYRDRVAAFDAFTRQRGGKPARARVEFRVGITAFAMDDGGRVGMSPRSAFQK